jgi:hypothetical protein
MTFNYFDNRSILGKSTNQGIGTGITNLSSEQAGIIEYVTHSLGNGTFTNNVTGTSVATVGNIGDSSSTQTIITYQVTGNKFLNWSLTVSSEGGYDFGSLTLNGVLLSSISGETTQSGIKSLNNGTNTLTIGYSKDISDTAGSDKTTATWSFT